MTAFPVDRDHPPRAIAYRDATHAIVMRSWNADDVDAFLEAFDESRPELRAFLNWAHLPNSRVDQAKLFARFAANYLTGADFVVGLFDDGGRVLGGAGLHARVPLNPRGWEIGYWVRSSCTKRGYATLVTQVLTAFAFDWLDADRVQILVDDANLPSARVAEKAGFALEGVMRNALTALGDDMREAGHRGSGRVRLYAMTPEDLPALPWLGRIRASLRVTDALGGEHRGGPDFTE